MNSLELVFGVVNSIWRSANLRIEDPGTSRVWQMAINDMPASTVMLGVEALARSEDKFAPNPGRFRKLCFEHAEIKRQQTQHETDMRAYAKARQAIEQRTPKETAYSATCQAFNRRVLKASFERAGTVTPEIKAVINKLSEAFDHGERWQTDFDVEYVAMSAKLPDEESDPPRPKGGWPDGIMPSHRAAWSDLRDRFEREWASRV